MTAAELNIEFKHSESLRYAMDVQNVFQSYWSTIMILSNAIFCNVCVRDINQTKLRAPLNKTKPRKSLVELKVIFYINFIIFINLYKLNCAKI